MNYKELKEKLEGASEPDQVTQIIRDLVSCGYSRILSFYGKAVADGVAIQLPYPEKDVDPAKERACAELAAAQLVKDLLCA